MFEKLKKAPSVQSYKRMWPFVKPHWFKALLAILITIPIGSLDAVIALSLKPYMDLVVVDKSIQSPYYIPLLIILFTLLQSGLEYGATYLNTWVGAKITMGLKTKLYDKLFDIKENYTYPDALGKTNNFVIYTKFLSDKKDKWNNQFWR